MSNALAKMDPRIDIFKSENFNFETSLCQKFHIVGSILVCEIPGIRYVRYLQLGSFFPSLKTWS